MVKYYILPISNYNFINCYYIMNYKETPNQSNSNVILPSKSEIERLGYSCESSIILDDFCPKCHPSEWEGKIKLIDNKFCNNKHININFHDKETIRIASYNVHNWITVYSAYKKKRNFSNFSIFFKKLNADILCLQEVTPIFDKPIASETKIDLINNYNFKFLIQSMKDIGYEYSAISNYNIDKLLSNYDQQYHVLSNAIFSKHKFKSHIHNIPGSRNIIIALFEIQGKKTIVVNTHLEYSKKNFDLELVKKKFGNNNIKVVQVQAVLELIDKYSKKYNTQNIFLTGDLNTPLHQFPINFFKKRFFQPLNCKTKTNLSSNSITDYILLSKTMSNNVFIMFYKAIGTPLSDHLPVYMDFFFKNSIDIKYQSKFCKKKIVMSLINNICDTIDPSYILDYNTDNIIKYITLRFTDKIVDQYYLNVKSWYFCNNIDPLFAIKRYSYISLVKHLIKFNSFYKEYEKIAKKYNGKEIKIDDKNQIDFTEDMLLQYIKCRPKCKVITVWPKIDFLKHKEDFMTLLRNHGDMYYIKSIELDYEAAMSLIYQLYATTPRNKTLGHIEFNTKSKGWENKHDTKKIYVIFYEYGQDENNIGGSDSEFKTKLRDLWSSNDLATI